ncbi:MAG: alpha,alpha-phosphotrehalase [Chordicoccus sp.]
MSDFRNSTVYQIYVKSFCDSNGDGIGDLNGIRSKLPYLKDLGVDYVWLTPFFRSPMNDNGYDVADYYSVNPMFGTMDDADAMIREANELGLGLMFDMVFNHTSTDHEWFQKALAGDPAYMDYYIWKDPVNRDADGHIIQRSTRSDESTKAANLTPSAGSQPSDQIPAPAPNSSPEEIRAFAASHVPTNWVSKFGGSAWEYVPAFNKYYLHLFDRTQADLNWENPRVREELKNVIRFWKAKGLKGFRFDVVNLISKPAVFEDDFEGDGRRFYTDGRHVHEFLRELAEDTGIADMMTVGEMSSTSLANCVRYANPASHELKMVFSFHHLKVDYKNGQKWELMAPDFRKLRELFREWQEGMEKGGAWNAVFWNNHDQPRANSRFGDVTHYWKESSKMLATLIHLMRGTPYIYEGEEIGMTNAGFTSIDQYRDVESINYYRILTNEGKSPEEALHIIGERSRDNGRTPMQWTAGRYAGFMPDDAKHEPWIGIPDNKDHINVAVESHDSASILSYYKKLIRLRKEYEIIADGSIRFTDPENENIISYVRELGSQKLHVFCNLRGEEESLLASAGGFDATGMQRLIDSVGDEAGTVLLTKLRPYEAVALLEEN